MKKEMQFEEVWQLYDFTEAQLVSMSWQFPYDYVLNLHYYWELNRTSTSVEVATVEQPLKLILKSCTRLDVQISPNQVEATQPLVNLGTIVGWGQVTPSPWLQGFSDHSSEWVHIFFEIGGNSKIEALAKSLSVELLRKPPLAELSS